MCVCVCGGTSIDNSVFCRTQRGFGYGYGSGFLDRNNPSLDKGILKLHEGSHDIGLRIVIGIISLRAGDLWISGSWFSRKYISEIMEKKSDVCSYGGNESTYLRMGVAKTMRRSAELLSVRIITKTKINHIEISRERTRHPDEPPAEDGHAILRSDLEN